MNATDTTLARPPLDTFAATLLVVLCLSWGLNQVAIKVANGGLQPAFQAGMRAGIGCALIIAWCRLRGVPLFTRDGTLIPGLVAGAVFGVEFVLIYVALDYTTVSRSIVFLYLMPFVVAVGAHFFIAGERLTAVRVVGLVAAFAGVVVAFSDKLSLPSPEALIGDALSVVAAFGWAATTLIIRTTRLATASPEKVAVYQLAVGSALALAAAPFFGPIVRDFDWLVAVAFAYQTLVVVSVTYLAWFWLLTRHPATELAAFTFLAPVFGVLFGGLFLSEPVTPRLVAALAMVAAGIYLVNRRARA